jgi:hypothetical protein
MKKYFGTLFRLIKSMAQQLISKVIPIKMPYDNSLVFIAGMPKSGTTWLENLIGNVPEIRRLFTYDPSNLLSEHILDPVLLENIPVRGNYFIKTHVEARHESVDALRKHKTPTVIMVRDIRDQCVSRFYHVLNEPGHPHHDLYLNGDRAEAFSHCVSVSATEYAQWIRDWISVINSCEQQFILVKYEEMHADVKVQFLRVLKHFEINLDNSKVDKIISSVSAAAKKGSDLAKQIKLGKNTLRGGRIGDWRKHFSSKDVEYLKSTANDVLVMLEYENSSSWYL